MATDKLEIRLGADTREFQRKMEAVQKRLERTADASKRLMGAVAALGAAATIAGGAAVKLAGDFEQAEIAFETMLGSAKEADKFLRDLAAFAKATPFQFVELQDAAKRMMAYGFAAEQVIPMLRTLGDATAALGGGSQMIQRVVVAMGQMQAKGRVMTQEMNQLTETGINAWQTLADTLGITVAEAMDKVEKRQVSAAVAIPALLAGMNADFAGLMDKQAKTLLGMWSNLQDEMTLTGIQVGQDLIDAFNLKEALSGAIEALGRFRERIEEVGLAGILEGWRTGLILTATTIGAALIPALYSLVVAASAAAVALAPFLIGGAILGGLFLLGQRLHDAAQNGQDFSEEVAEGKKQLGKFEASAKTAKTAVEKLTEATDEDGFLGALDDLTSTLDEDASNALESFARAHALPLIAQGELQDAIDITLEKFATMRAEAIRAELEVAKALQGTVINAVRLARADIDFFTEAIEEAKDAGDEAGAIIATEELAKAQTEVTNLTAQYIEQSKTISDLRAELGDLEEAQAVLNDETLTAEERLDKFLELLGFVPTATNDAADGVEDLGEKADKTAEAVERLNRALLAVEGSRIPAIPASDTGLIRPEEAGLGNLPAWMIRGISGTEGSRGPVISRPEETGAFEHRRRFFSPVEGDRPVPVRVVSGRNLTRPEETGAFELNPTPLPVEGNRAPRRFFRRPLRPEETGAFEVPRDLVPRVGPIFRDRGDGGLGDLRFNQDRNAIRQRGDGDQLERAHIENLKRELEARRKLVENLTMVGSEDGPLTAFGKTLLNAAAEQIPAFGAALEGFVTGGPIGAISAIFGEMLAVMEPFKNLMKVINDAFGKVAEVVGQILAPVFNVLGVIVRGLANAFVAVINFVMEIITFGFWKKIDPMKGPSAGGGTTPDAPSTPRGGAFGTRRGDPSYNPDIALSVGRSNAAPATSTALISVADLFGSHVDKFGGAVDKFVSGANKFARVNGGL